MLTVCGGVTFVSHHLVLCVWFYIMIVIFLNFKTAYTNNDECGISVAYQSN